MYLDYAERQAEKRVLMTMEDWAEKLDAFLQFNEYEILKDAGKVVTKVAKELAEGEYEKFRVEQDGLYESDFDREVRRVLMEKARKQITTDNGNQSVSE